MKTYRYPQFAYRLSDEQRTGRVQRHPVVIIGAGPVGLTAALDLAQQGIPAVILDDDNTVSVGSRAVCYAQRPLQIWDRLGVGDRLMARGVSWEVGRIFFGDRQVWKFDHQAGNSGKCPPFVNLQQYYLEEELVEACTKVDAIDLRWKHRLISLQQTDECAVLTVETPDGVFTMEAEWTIACDGANSSARRMVGADFVGQFFQDRFLIADIVMKADFPTEQWFWFDPPFHRQQSALLLRQSDNVWRLDFQLGWDADPAIEKRPEKIIPRIKAMLGEDVEFELEWACVYQFACRRIDRFRHGRVVFAGDSAHQFSPFGARGANSGVQDADNLAWKLALVLKGKAPVSLVDSYHDERAYAADENLLNSARSTGFVTPKNAAARRFRDAVLQLAKDNPFARPLVNSGRLSAPTAYLESPLCTPDAEAFEGRLRPGAPCVDAPVQVDGKPAWFLNLIGKEFTLLEFGGGNVMPVSTEGVTAKVVRVGREFSDPEGVLARLYDGRSGTVYLIRPDQYVAARWRSFDRSAVEAALIRSISGR